MMEKEKAGKGGGAHAMLGPEIPQISRLEGLDISGDAKKFVPRHANEER